VNAADIVIRPGRPGDAQALADIYNVYVRGALSTFEETPVSAETMAGRMKDSLDAGLPWLVAEAGGRPLGYSYAGVWKARSAYRYVAETSIYLDEAARGRKLGKRLYGALIDVLRAKNLHQLIAGIAVPNDASVALHESFGYRKTAHFEQIGYKLGRWLDVTYWQLTLPGAKPAPL
jgi:L-amino acid N-acyltransferase YncA